MACRRHQHLVGDEEQPLGGAFARNGDATTRGANAEIVAIAHQRPTPPMNDSIVTASNNAVRTIYAETDTNIRNAYAEEIARAEQEAAGHREVAHAALDLLHTAYLEEANTYETLERYRAENRELREENARLKAGKGQS
jgi:hypothetical protein